MPAYQAVTIFLLSLAAAAVTSLFVARLRSDLSRLAFWFALLAVSAMASGASALVLSTRHSGTGFTTSYGWPKAFYFRYLSETGQRGDEFSLFYFLGNSLAYAGPLLVLCAIWRMIRR